MPSLEQIIQFILTPLQWAFLIFPILSLYVTYVHIKWWNTYKPSPLIRHLLMSSIAVDISALIVAFIVANVFGLIPIEMPRGANTLLLAIALGISLGVKVYRRINLRALDQAGVDVAHRAETQDQREDREFGEKRRQLEVDHIEDSGS